MVKLDQSLADVPGIGTSYLSKLSRLNLFTVSDLIWFFPRRYEDYSKTVKVAEIKSGEKATVKGVIKAVRSRNAIRRRLSVTEAVLSDETGSVKLIWFNQSYLARQLKVGQEILVAGSVEIKNGIAQIISPAYEDLSAESRHLGRIIPIYPETAGLSSKWLRDKVYELLNSKPEMKDILPADLPKRHKLPGLGHAIAEIHFPTTWPALERAKFRIAFEEMLILQLSGLALKSQLQKLQSEEVVFNKSAADEFVRNLPFEFTPAQKKAAWEIIQDMGKTHPMHRLVEGDVGSGKTAVALMAVHQVFRAGLQSLIMSPTEVLARQHHKTVKAILDPLAVKSEMLLGSTKPAQKREIFIRLAQGEIDLLVGTHSLIGDKVIFKNLALAVIDEQHRFGVNQREKLRRQKTIPHLLSLSATPIPRSLAQTIYGDLEVSIIAQKPAGRKPVTTESLGVGEEGKAFEKMSEEVKKGRQAFIIYPLVNPSDKLMMKSATRQFELLQKDYPHFKLGLLHGQLKADEKDRLMTEFAEGKLDILVATGVVEVGIDVANATVMIVEHSDRFGLASLHQLRGRVGRGAHQSYCFVLSDSEDELTIERLRQFAKISDGFELARLDLKNRGPGQVYGTLQHGFYGLKMANLLDHNLIKLARDEAATLLKADPDLKRFPELAAQVKLANERKTVA